MQENNDSDNETRPQ